MSTVLHRLLKIAEEQRLTSDDFARTLSFVKVRALKAAGQHADGGGLVLHVSASGSKSWRHRFRLDGRPQTLTIGSFPAVGLEEARNAHRAARWLVARGLHPLKHVEGEIEREQAEKQARTENTFGAIAENWMTATASNLSPRTVKHREAMLAKHVFPILGERPIKEIVRKDLHTLLTKLDQVSPVTAKHCRGYIGQIFEYAEDAELVEANPTPRAGVLVKAMGRSVKPRKALPLNRLGEFLRTLEDAPETDPLTKTALKLLVLTWSRTSEVTGARWEEFDLDAGTWVIPADRMKGKEPHTVRLSQQAVRLLRELRERSKGEVLFPNRRKPGETMSRTTLYQWRTRWGFADIMDVHGLRAVASTWANEAGKYRPDVIEVALAHKEGDRVRAAYNRAQFVDEVRRLWQDWADVCDEKLKIARAQNVVELPKAAA
ncbi:tyrosine-type recombinase/integrase [Aromatoleum buckelii]|uniref:Tyrosine-type recombinase/integrase n=1 Tax=Aromatoleum buckelii TaxID=200254 RepID=A0ABX1N1P4_9RHOO|nr:tyrosine-type recombinase/integrase [Aromatoleum buckelii]MCK0510915.1 tyrosine-type recombinase/integrase [Aromatoleum buckelii]